MPKAVFAGCARTCAPFLSYVLPNIEALASTYDAFELVIVENDSIDDTKAILREYAGARDNVRLIEADGLDEQYPKRTDRIAAARNLYMEVVRETRYADCDDLVVVDFDDVNCRRISPSAFAAARAWLWQEPNRRAVFANTTLFYYDVWALRHPTWSPDDCWSRVRATEATEGTEEAIRRHVATRQIPVPPRAAPILVDSAFGGLGIYRREQALAGTYVGLDGEGEETCEHVAFNAAVRGANGTMAIYPALQNQTPQEHILTTLGGSKTFALDQDGARASMIGPPEHPLESFRATEPLYDRRLPVLARIVSSHAPNGSFIDVGANIGDSIVLARLAGARMPAIAIEASLTYCKFFWLNAQRSPDLFSDTRLVWGYAGGTGTKGEVSLGAGTASAAGSASATTVESAPRLPLSRVARDRDVSLLKTDTDGFDQDIVAAELPFLRSKEPILWMEAQTLSGADETKWRSLLSSMADQWPNMMLFDNFGFAIAAGATNALADHAVDLMAYGRRQRERAQYKPTLYYLDIALFPARFDQVYDEFCRSILELAS
jgi:FkbM family methyltransferase